MAEVCRKQGLRAAVSAIAVAVYAGDLIRHVDVSDKNRPDVNAPFFGFLAQMFFEAYLELLPCFSHDEIDGRMFAALNTAEPACLGKYYLLDYIFHVADTLR